MQSAPCEAFGAVITGLLPVGWIQLCLEAMPPSPDAGGRTTVMGSEPEWQEFFRNVAKPQDRFQDRASALLMTATGWGAEIAELGMEPPQLSHLTWIKVSSSDTAHPVTAGGTAPQFLCQEPPAVTSPNSCCSGPIVRHQGEAGSRIN